MSATNSRSMAITFFERESHPRIQIPNPPPLPIYLICIYPTLSYYKCISLSFSFSLSVSLLYFFILFVLLFYFSLFHFFLLFSLSSLFSLFSLSLSFSLKENKDEVRHTSGLMLLLNLIKIFQFFKIKNVNNIVR